MRRQLRFNRVPEKVPEKVVGDAEPGQVQQGSGEGFRRRLQEALVQLGSTRFWRRFRRRVPEKVPEKVPGSLGAKRSQV